MHAELQTNNDLGDISKVSLNPILMATPADHQTIFTTLKQGKEATNKLRQNYTPIYFCMGLLLMKALEIVWVNPDESDGVIPSDGGMHFLMSAISGICYLHGDDGLHPVSLQWEVGIRSFLGKILIVVYML